MMTAKQYLAAALTAIVTCTDWTHNRVNPSALPK
jgi:hypothetical protein